jgi:outer membrane protein assembly factor BamB
MNNRFLVVMALLSLTCSSNGSMSGPSTISGTGGAGTAGTGGATGGATGGTGGTGRGGGGTSGTTGAAGNAATGGTTAGTGGAGTAGAGGSVSGGGSVLQHHNNASRDGVYVDARLTRAAAATIHVDATFANSPILGPVYAQPLYLSGTNGGPDLVIASTAQNRVYALNASTGVEVWNRLVGTPVTAGLCGRPLNPLGITGTPVIDPATRTIYLDAMTNTGATGAHHMVHALNPDALGADRSGWPVDLDATARSGAMVFASPVQNQRGALVLMGGSVFVPFGGHIGDCDAYHGWIVGISTANPTQVSAWASAAFGAGIWGSSGIASDGTSLYVTTGNTKALATSGGRGSSPTSWGGGEAALKFPATLSQPALATTTDYFYPSNWAAMDIADLDLGGAGPVLFTVPAANPSNLIMALGKDANAYLLNRANLGGMDAQPLVPPTVVAGDQIINAAAAYTTATGTYVVFKNGGATGCPAGQTGGLTAIRIAAASPPTMAIAWCGGPATNGSPAVSMTDTAGGNAVVWVVGNDNRLYGLNGDNGQSIVAGATAMATVKAHQSPIVVGGRIFVASDTRIYAYIP